jgi:hypothetical protein
VGQFLNAGAILFGERLAIDSGHLGFANGARSNGAVLRPRTKRRVGKSILFGSVEREL